MIASMLARPLLRPGGRKRCSRAVLMITSTSTSITSCTLKPRRPSASKANMPLATRASASPSTTSPHPDLAGDASPCPAPSVDSPAASWRLTAIRTTDTHPGTFVASLSADGPSDSPCARAKSSPIFTRRRPASLLSLLDPTHWANTSRRCGSTRRRGSPCRSPESATDMRKRSTTRQRCPPGTSRPGTDRHFATARRCDCQ